jgi:DNA-binding MarR family transcriptional regulator/GNAT superfamily N-acetyltransferase
MSAAGSTQVDQKRVAAVREFNRFYTPLIGLLGDRFLGTGYSLTEARVLFELAQRDETEVVELRRELDLDAGYLSRILARFEAAGIASRGRSELDRRRQVVRLTRRGRARFRVLDRRSAAEVGGLLSRLDDSGQEELIGAMGSIRRALANGAGPETGVILREPQPGDLGWIVERHGALYAREYGWDERFEALVSRVVADFAASRDPARERAWIAGVDGARAGCILCVAKSRRVAQLRLLLVDPRFRRLGIGETLVDECVSFARSAGYREMTLWTNDVLTAARPIYERAGFEVVAEAAHDEFGPRIVGQHMRVRL